MLRNFDLEKTLTVRQVLDIVEALGITNEDRTVTVKSPVEDEWHDGEFHGIELYGITLRDFEAAILEEI